ncbi:MAG: hypothetical protein WCJ64_17665 [Rhodospirillaceae bacterium]
MRTPSTAAASFPPIAATRGGGRVAGGGADFADLALSPFYRFSQIPGARFAIRSRFAADLPRLPGGGPPVLTSPDGRLARWADAATVTGREVRVLAGGTAAWSEDGRFLTGQRRGVSLGARRRLPPALRGHRQFRGRHARLYRLGTGAGGADPPRRHSGVPPSVTGGF